MWGGRRLEAVANSNSNQKITHKRWRLEASSKERQAFNNNYYYCIITNKGRCHSNQLKQPLRKMIIFLGVQS